MTRLMVDSDDADSDDPVYEPRPEWAKGELVSNQDTVLAEIIIFST